MVAVWVVLVASGSALALAARGSGPLPGDLALTWTIQRPPPNGLLGSWLTHGSDLVWWLFAPLAVLIALVLRRWLDALFILLAGSTGVVAGTVIKGLVARPRPTTDLVRVYDSPESYSFPSTTSFFTAVLIGTVGYLIWRPGRRVAIVAFGGLLLLSSGLSRVYVGAHWATDILGGWLLGGAWLIVLIALHRWWLSRETAARDPT